MRRKRAVRERDRREKEIKETDLGNLLLVKRPSRAYEIKVGYLYSTEASRGRIDCCKIMESLRRETSDPHSPRTHLSRAVSPFDVNLTETRQQALHFKKKKHRIGEKGLTCSIPTYQN